MEGIDGCGKSTQFEMLQQKMRKHGISFVAVREPGGTAAGEDIRQILLQNSYSLTAHAELLLYIAARAELTEQVILPALLKGDLVICDRFLDSTMAYQGYAGGLELDWIRLLNQKSTGNIVPDLTVLLDITVSAAFERRNHAVDREADRMEKKNIAYHERVRAGYLAIARAEPHRMKTIDASTGVEQQGHLIWQLIQYLIDRRIKKGISYEF